MSLQDVDEEPVDLQKVEELDATRFAPVRIRREGNMIYIDGIIRAFFKVPDGDDKIASLNVTGGGTLENW